MASSIYHYLQFHVVLIILLALNGSDQTDNNRANLSRLPAIESLKRNFAFRSGGNELIVVFSKQQSKTRSNSVAVKLVLFYDDENIPGRNRSLLEEVEFEDASGANYTVSNEPEDFNETTIVDDGAYDITFASTPREENGVSLASTETSCRFVSGTDREYLCPIPNVSRLFPNFTADNWEGTVVVVEMLQFGGCSNASASSGCRRLCFGVTFDGQLAPARHRRLSNHQTINQKENDILEEKRRQMFTIKYYPDPVLTSVALLPPNNLISVGGYGFDLGGRNALPQFELIAGIASNKNEPISIHCNTTYRNANENGFMCLFEPTQLRQCMMNKMPKCQAQISVRFGNWSAASQLVFEKLPRPNQGSRRPPERAFPAPFMPFPFPPPPPYNDGWRASGMRQNLGSELGTGQEQGPTKDDADTQKARPNSWPRWDRPEFGLGHGPRPSGSSYRWLLDGNSTMHPFSEYGGRKRGFGWQDEQSRLRNQEMKSNATTYELSSSVSPNVIAQIVAPICAVLLLLITAFALLCCLRRTPLRRTKFVTLFFPLSEKTKSNGAAGLQKFSLKLLPPFTVATLSQHQIEKERLIIAGNDLGEGFFGIVRSALLYPSRPKKSPLSATVSSPEPRSTLNSGDDNMPQKVAVKTIQRYENLEKLREFFEEAIIMFSLQHPNVLSAIGFVDDMEGYPAIVLPLMDGGNLHDFVRTSLEFDDTMLFNFAWQIAKGMSYLASLKLVHRDLAARNCLLNKQLVAKVSDFGLTRHSESVSYEYGVPEYKMLSQHRPLPIRWLAPECLEAGTFTEKSDVWAYGVLLWEMATRGDRPYGNIESGSIFNFVRFENGRLPKTSVMSNELYEIMSKCWKEHSSERPTFAELVDVTGTLLEDQPHGDYCDPHIYMTQPTTGGGKQPLEKATSLNSEAESVRSLVTNVTSLPVSVMTDVSQLTDDSFVISGIAIDHQSDRSSACSTDYNS